MRKLKPHPSGGLATKANEAICPKCRKEEVYHNGEAVFCIKCKVEFNQKEARKIYEKARKRWKIK